MNDTEKKLISYLEICLEQIQEYSPDNEYILGQGSSLSIEELSFFIKQLKETNLTVKG